MMAKSYHRNILPPSGRYSVFSSLGSSHNAKSEPSGSANLHPFGPGSSMEQGHFGHGMLSDSSQFSNERSRMPVNPPKNLGHRRAHSEILTLPDDTNCDSDLGFVGGLDGPSFSDYTEDDFLSMYLGMDKFNSTSATSSFQVNGSSAPLVATNNALSEKLRIRHQHSQSMVGSTTIKPDMLTDGSEDRSSTDCKKAMLSATRLKEREVSYMSELEREVQTLQTEATSLSTHLTLLQRDTNGPTSENSELLQTMEQQVHLQAENEVPVLATVGYHQPLHRLKRSQWWILVVLNILFLIVGQAAAVLLGRYYYDKGGNSKWMATLVQTAAFPLLLIPYLFFHSADESPSLSAPPSIRLLFIIYIVVGVIIAGDNILYSIGLLHLSASTYSLICATQLVFNAVFSFFINGQKFTALILNSVVILSLSAALLATNDDVDKPSGVSRGEYILGVLTTVAASALYSLVLSLMQLTFEKVLKKESFSVVLDMQIYTSIVATCMTIVGLFASGEWTTIRGEMDSFTGGKVSYIMTLVCTAVAWQICSVGVVGLIFVVSSLFSNVISTLSLAVTPIASLIIFHDKMNGVKIIAMLLAFGGFASYIYQNYLDDLESRKNQTQAHDASGDPPSLVMISTA